MHNDLSKIRSAVLAFLVHLRNRYFLLWDVVTLPLAAYLAFVLRLETTALQRYCPTLWVYMAAATLAQIAVLRAVRGYSRYWPFASLPELSSLVWGAFGGELLGVAFTVMVTETAGYPAVPRSVPVIHLMLSTLWLAVPRLGIRSLYGYLKRHNGHTQPGGLQHVFIIGAGEAGRMVLDEIKRNPQTGFLPVGWIDDNPAKHSLLIQGLTVLGGMDSLPRLARAYNVNQALVAIPSATGKQMRHILEACSQAGIQVLTLPGVYELLSGTVDVQRFRPVRVEDLLARDPVQLDPAPVQRFLQGKPVLVTGAGGSIGSELCRQIARCEPASLILLGHGENSVFQIFHELHRLYPGLTLHPVIADLQHRERIARVFARYQPEIVFHAAAHKHVTLMELNPEEAVINNVGGTRNLLAAAERFGIANFVMISTDKAVNPTSVMGATKRVSEHLVRAAAARTRNPYVAVRFGNVLGSRGSVVPIFERQIKAGGPVTVTHPEVKRFFMTIPEAVQLVLQASILGNGGEIFVLDMGEPVKILDLAKDMVRLAGLEVNRDIDIVFTGLKPGEKLFEEIFHEGEAYHATRHRKIFVTIPENVDLADFVQDVDRLLQTANAGDRSATFLYLQQLVPECVCTLGQQEPAKEHQPLVPG